MRSFADVPVIQQIPSMSFVPESLNISLCRKFSPRVTGWHSKQAGTGMRHNHPNPVGRFANKTKTYEGNPAVRDLPDPDSGIGKLYYNNIPIRSLLLGICVSCPRFARKTWSSTSTGRNSYQNWYLLPVKGRLRRVFKTQLAQNPKKCNKFRWSLHA